MPVIPQPVGSQQAPNRGGFEIFLSRLPNAHFEPSGWWRAHCPAHDDKHASLRFREVGDGAVWFECKAGCPKEAILQALGLTWRDLDPKKDHHITRYVLRDPSGNSVAIHVRKDLPGGKKFWWELPDGQRDLGGRRVTELPLYGVEKLGDAATVVIVEGEKAAEALMQLGVAAVGTVTGAGAVPGDEALRPLVRPGRRVVLWPDADPPGIAHMDNLGRSLLRLGAGEVYMITPPEGVRPGWDSADAVAEGQDVAAIIEGARPFKPLEHPKPRILTARELLTSEASEDPGWVLEGLLPAGGLSLLVGRPKSGKSTLLRAIAVAIAQGRPILGRNVVQGGVLLISLEDRQADVVGHLRLLGLRADDPLFLTVEKPTREELKGWILDYGVVFVGIDTFGKLVYLQDISSYTQVLGALGWVHALARETGCHITLTHHTPKFIGDRDAIDAPLGSTALSGTADTVLYLRRAPEKVRYLSSEQRIGEPLPEHVLVVGEDGWPSLGKEREEHEVHAIGDQVLEFLRNHPGATRDEIDEGVGGRHTLVFKTLYRLLREGKVTRTGTGRRGDPFRYSQNTLLSCPHILSGTGKTETIFGAQTRTTTELFPVPDTPGSGEGTGDRKSNEEGGRGDPSLDILSPTPAGSLPKKGDTEPPPPSVVPPPQSGGRDPLVEYALRLFGGEVVKIIPAPPPPHKEDADEP